MFYSPTITKTCRTILSLCVLWIAVLAATLPPGEDGFGARDVADDGSRTLGTSLIQGHVSISVVRASPLLQQTNSKGQEALLASCLPLDEQGCSKSDQRAGNKYALPRTPWFLALEFVLGAITAKFLMKLRGEVDPDEKPLKKSLEQSWWEWAWTTRGGVRAEVEEVAGRAPVKSHACLARTGVQSPSGLLKAVRAKDSQQVAKLLQVGVPANAEDEWGCTALHIAADSGDIEVVRALLENGAQVLVREAWDEVPLHFAARAGHTAVCELLLSHGTEVNITNADDSTPLMLAAQSGHEATCEVLLARGGVAGEVADDKLPPLLQALFVRRCLA